MTKSMSKPRLDVMLSSTSRDLPIHRAQATNGILRLRSLGMYPVIMETLGARLGDPINESLKMVDYSEIYVGIFAHRYGYIPDDPRNPDRISITEMEYRRAMAREMPVLIFIMDSKHPLPDTVGQLDNFMEPTAEGKAKLKLLKDELLEQHTVGMFNSPEDLRGQIVQALSAPEVIERAEAIAGEMEKRVEPVTISDRHQLPKPPELYADPPYILTTQFVGRSQELRRLDEWAQSGDPIMLVEAIGGMGKSAVTWQWINEHALKSGEYDGVMWWSFYESGATMSAFVRHALAYITRRNPDSLKSDTMKVNFKQLRDELKRGRYLLVLDGLERVLVAYHRWNAAQMRDDTVEDSKAIIKERDIRACTDPDDEDILRDLLTCYQTKFLISTRLIPRALQDRHTDILSNGVTHIRLGGLHPNDALELVQHSGVTVDNSSQFHIFMKTFGYHSLLVKLIAGRINRSRQARGDFSRWYRSEGRNINVTDLDVRQSQTHILEYAFDGLDDTARRFLSQVAAFGDAVPYDTLAVFNPYRNQQFTPEEVDEPNTGIWEFLYDQADTDEEKAHWLNILDEEKARYKAYLEAQKNYELHPEAAEYRVALSRFDAMLTDLENRGLLRWDQVKDTYDMHPVVRGTAFAALREDDKAITFERIREHLEAQPPEDIDAAQEVADLANTIGVYRALLGAGKWDEAASFYLNRLENKLHHNIAAYYVAIELLVPLFPDGTDTLPRLNDPHKQNSITTTLANVFYLIGSDDEALVLRGVALKAWLDNDDIGNLISDLRNYAISLRVDRLVALAERAWEAALRLAEAIEDQNQISMSRLFLLASYRDIGQWDKVNATYTILSENPPGETYWCAAVEKFYAETLICRGLDATEALDKAESLAQKSNNALIYRQIVGLRGEMALQREQYDAAIHWFKQDIHLRRKAGSSDVITPLGGLARAYALKGDHTRAREIIESGIGGIDAAEVYYIIEDTVKAQVYAREVYKGAWADGPPYVFWWELERAKKILDALDEPYPDMPPFDPDKVGKFAYQDEIEAVIERERTKRT